jgi:hypothetical protein
MMSTMAANGLKGRLEDWNHINWKKVNKFVRNLRQRIFRARKLGDFRKLRSVAVVDVTKLRKFIVVSSTYHSDQPR